MKVTSPATGWSVRIAYLVFLALVLLAPFDFRAELGYLAARLRGALEFGVAPSDVVDGARNVLLFAGWGLVWFTTARPTPGRPRRVEARRIVLAALATAAASGLAAEALQLGLPSRTPSLLDAGTNALGGGLGAGAGALVLASLRRSRGRGSLLGVPTAVLAAPYVLAVLAEAVFPLLRQQGPPGRHGGPAGRIVWTVEHFELSSLAVLPPLEFVLFVPAGLLCAMALWEGGLDRSASVRRTALLGAGVALLGETLHAPIARPFELGPILVHAAGFAAGGWLISTPAFARWIRSSDAARRTVAFLAGYLAVLAMWSWRPFVPELDPSRWLEMLEMRRWIPMATHGARRTLVSVVDVLRGFLLFVPVGAVLAFRPLRDRGPLSALWPAVYAALVLEVGQTAIAGRFFDMTDPVVALAGAAITWTLVRRAGLPRSQPPAL